MKESGSLSFWSIWSWITEMLVFGVVPVSILLLNVRVILETRRLALSEKLLMSHSKPRGGGGAHKASSSYPSATTVMLLAVSFFLIITTLPVTVLYVLYLSFDEGDPALSGQRRLDDPKWQRHFAYTEVRTVVEELGMSHYALNFYIYLFTGRIFRRELWRLGMRVLRVDAGGGGRRHMSWFEGGEESAGFMRVRGHGGAKCDQIVAKERVNGDVSKL